LEEFQNRYAYHQRHVELREELRSLQAMVYSFAAHVQGSQPLDPAVGEPTQVPAQSQEPADEVLPNTEKLLKAFVKGRKRILLQRSFSELCKFSYKHKVSRHDWCPEGAGLVEPDERWKYIYGAWYFSRQWEGWEGQARRSRGDLGGRQAFQRSDSSCFPQACDFYSGGWSSEGTSIESTAVQEAGIFRQGGRGGEQE
jgi:hypothetical protein